MFCPPGRILTLGGSVLTSVYSGPSPGLLTGREEMTQMLRLGSPHSRDPHSFPPVLQCLVSLIRVTISPLSVWLRSPLFLLSSAEISHSSSQEKIVPLLRIYSVSLLSNLQTCLQLSGVPPPPAQQTTPSHLTLCYHLCSFLFFPISSSLSTLMSE